MRAPSPKSPVRFRQGAIGVLIALALAAGAIWWQSRAPEFEPVSPGSMAQPLPSKPAIAVLALDDLVGAE